MTFTTITARVSQPGLHHWPTAPEQRAYLRDPHRHLFVARATVYVGHDERDVEFHDLGDDLLSALRGATGTLAFGSHQTSLYDFGAQSCESLARHCCEVLGGRYALGSISVSEDDEFTATHFPDPISLTGAVAPLKESTP